MRKFEQWIEDPASGLLCSIDPISAAVGGLVTGAASIFGGSKPETPPTPQAPPPQAAPQAKPAPKQSTQTPGSSFIGGVPTPPPSSGSKTLLGQ